MKWEWLACPRATTMQASCLLQYVRNGIIRSAGLRLRPSPSILYSSETMKELIRPHGGELRELFADAARASVLKQEALALPSCDLTLRQQAELALLMNGAYSPLSGFMCRADYDAVLETGHLASGELWPLPVTLDIDEALAVKLTPGAALALRDLEGVLFAVLRVDEVWRPDREVEAMRLFGTTDTTHPGVGLLLGKTLAFYVGGRDEGEEAASYHSITGPRRGLSYHGAHSCGAAAFEHTRRARTRRESAGAAGGGGRHRLLLPRALFSRRLALFRRAEQPLESADPAAPSRRRSRIAVARDRAPEPRLLRALVGGGRRGVLHCGGGSGGRGARDPSRALRAAHLCGGARRVSAAQRGGDGDGGSSLRRSRIAASSARGLGHPREVFISRGDCGAACPLSRAVEAGLHIVFHGSFRLRQVDYREGGIGEAVGARRSTREPARRRRGAQTPGERDHQEWRHRHLRPHCAVCRTAPRGAADDRSVWRLHRNPCGDPARGVRGARPQRSLCEGTGRRAEGVHGHQ